MRPWQHALSSSRSTGHPWTEDLEIHEFLDMTKAACADRRHRVVLHSVDLGSDLAALAFPLRSDVRAVVLQHIVEDLGRAYTLADWFDRCDIDRLPRPLHRRLTAGRDRVIALVVGR